MPDQSQLRAPPGLEAPAPEDLPAPPGLGMSAPCSSAPEESAVPLLSWAPLPSAPSTAGDDGAAQKEFFEPHLDREEAEAQWRAGTLIRGKLCVNGHRPSHAFLRPDGSKDNDDNLLVDGRKARNRAVHGDIVFVKPTAEKRLREADVEDAILLSDDEGGSFAGSGSDDDEDIVLRHAVLATDARAEQPEGEDNDGSSIKTGEVVAIAETKGRDRVVVCTLHPLKEQDEGDLVIDDSVTMIKAKPTDKRMPWILIQVNDIVRNILKNSGQLSKYQLWPVQILIWRATSPLPLGRLKGQSLGKAGDLEAEVRHALIEHELDSHDVDFEDALLDEVDDIVEAAQKDFEEEAKTRYDLRPKRVFTIDPATAKDLDDAIHVDYDPALDQVEVGVHIADVGHFVKLGSLADTEARRRTTSVYLIDRVLPMLPHGLCNHLCSLNPNEPKLSFSAFFRLNRSTGELIGTPAPWFKKTVMCSCCRLNYDEVQELLDKRELPNHPPVYGNHSWESVRDDIFLLHEVCGKVRTARFDGGALAITATKMLFHVRESADGIPTGYHLESHSASHWIIEELMLLANRCVAEHLANSRLSNDGSVLRQHRPPDPKKVAKLEKLLKGHLCIPWISWDGRNAGSIHRSCQAIYARYGAQLGQCMEMFAMKAGMQQAEYFVYGPDEDPRHFALNFEYYTHFTSPIRRYPDVMVHRVLAALLTEEDDTFQREAVDEQVEICNEKRKSTRDCSKQLDRSVFCVYLRSRKEWFYTIGNVLALEEDRRNQRDKVAVYCSHLGKEKHVLLWNEEDLSKYPLFTEGVDDKLILPLTWKFRGRGSMEMTWPCGTRQTLRVLSSLPVVVIPTDTVPIDFAVFFVAPSHPKYAELVHGVQPDAQQGFEWHDFDPDADVIYSEETAS
mmetsp:Transcript_33140/g.72234  ORF Transcript_33140/g.72234 Transcript_33140/m.72234 type:complete len:900 (-) Transcript_33140:351-3050(-)